MENQRKMRKKMKISLFCTTIWYNLLFPLQMKTYKFNLKRKDYVDCICSIFYAFPYVKESGRKRICSVELQ